MTAPEREALVKALRRYLLCASDCIVSQCKSFCVYALVKEAADMIEALSAPAVTVTEEMVTRAMNALVYAGYNDETQRKIISRSATCRDYVRDALEAALKSTTPQTGSQE